MEAPSKTPLLDQIDVPADVRRLDKGQLRQLADELRMDMINQVAATGGHLRVEGSARLDDVPREDALTRQHAGR